MIWYTSVAVLTCVVVCESEMNNFKEENYENLENTPENVSIAHSNSNLLANVQEVFKAESQHEDIYEDQTKRIKELMNQDHINSKRRSILLQHLVRESTSMDTYSKERNKRATNNIPEDLLALNPNLQADINNIFGSQSSSIQHKPSYDNQSDNQGSLDDPELHENIRQTLLGLEPDTETNDKDSYNLNDKDSRLQANRNHLHESKEDIQSTDNNSANTSIPPKLNALILNFFGPEIVPNSNEKKGNGVNSEKHNEVHEKEDGTKNNSQAKETNVLVQAVMCLLVLLNI